MTSSLQIEASRKLRFDPERTMRAAQRLYEQGWITYMRTDSTTLSDEAIKRRARARGRDVWRRLRGRPAPSLRPQGEERPRGARGDSSGRRGLPHARRGAVASWAATSARVYDLVWKRTIASQMVDARLTQDRVRLSGTFPNVEGFDGDVAVALSASGLRIEFAGFRRAYVEGTDDPEAELADQERSLPALSEGRDVPVCERRGEVPRHPAARIASPKRR